MGVKDEALMHNVGQLAEKKGQQIKTSNITLASDSLFSQFVRISPFISPENMQLIKNVLISRTVTLFKRQTTSRVCVIFFSERVVNIWNLRMLHNKTECNNKEYLSSIQTSSDHGP